MYSEYTSGRCEMSTTHHHLNNPTCYALQLFSTAVKVRTSVSYLIVLKLSIQLFRIDDLIRKNFERNRFSFKHI